MQRIYIGYMYDRWRKMRGLDRDGPTENIGIMKSSFKDFKKKIGKLLFDRNLQRF